MKKIDLAIIIPTLNEEKYIGKLLDSLANQTVYPKEVVIVDASSSDKTLEEVEKRRKKLAQIRFYQVSKSTISCQRNFGVRQTTASHLLFLDADTLLVAREILADYLREVEKKKPGLAISSIAPLSNYWKDRLYFKGVNLLYRLAQPVWPMAQGVNLYIKREVFQLLGGFDEQVAVGEDFELVQRAVKKRYKFAILKHPLIHTSTRRLEKEGRRRFVLKMIRAGFKVAKGGHRANDIEYEFGRF